MVIQTTPVFSAISAASALGVLTIAVNDGLKVYPGAIGWVNKDDASANALVKVISVSGDSITVRRFKNDDPNSPPSYGRSDMSAFAATSHLNLEAQLVTVSPAHAKRDSA